MICFMATPGMIPLFVGVFVAVFVVYCSDKHGCLQEECVDLSSFVYNSCPHLEFCGLMVVGRVWDSASIEMNPDFLVSICWDEGDWTGLQCCGDRLPCCLPCLHSPWSNVVVW